MFAGAFFVTRIGDHADDATGNEQALGLLYGRKGGGGLRSHRLITVWQVAKIEHDSMYRFDNVFSHFGVTCLNQFDLRDGVPVSEHIPGGNEGFFLYVEPIDFPGGSYGLGKCQSVLAITRCCIYSVVTGLQQGSDQLLGDIGDGKRIHALYSCLSAGLKY